MQSAIEYLKQHRDTHRQWVSDVCRIPSISTEPDNAGDVRKAVEWTHDRCVEAGLKAEVIDTPRHPLCYAEWCEAGPKAPTYLVYGHADVQPTGDRSLWKADPFEPQINGEWLVARGSADNKGQFIQYIRAAAAWLQTAGKLPINLKILIEGEEEIGSPNLTPFILAHTDKLACDGILISDTSMHEDGYPTVTLGTRGMVYKEVILTGPDHDLHSGMGGAVVNPAWVLAHLLASLHDGENRVTLPGFYDAVVEPSAAEKQLYPKHDDAAFLKSIGAPALWDGEPGYTVQERKSTRPTLEFNGIYGGFQGKGANTIIPARAGAKISMRLVPNQPGEQISKTFDETIRARVPAGVNCEIISHGPAADAYVSPFDAPAMKAVLRALQDAFGREPAIIREGGTLPILPMFKQELGAESFMLGLASPNCNAHGPNEKVSLDDLDRGAETIVRLLGLLGGA